METITNWLSDHISVSVTLGTVVLLIATPLVVLLVRRVTQRLLHEIQPRMNLGFETSALISRLTTGAAWFLLGLMLLHLWGVNLGGLWTILVSAVTLIGVGFLATWTMISNFTASLFVTLWRPFQLGETVELLPENLKGQVVDRNMMFTILREKDGGLLQIPNNFFFQRMFRVTGSHETFWFESLREPNANRSSPEVTEDYRADNT